MSFLDRAAMNAGSAASPTRRSAQEKRACVQWRDTARAVIFRGY